MVDVLIDSQVFVKSGGVGMLKKFFLGLLFFDNFFEMIMLCQIGLLVGFVVSVVIGFVVVFWFQQLDYKLFYGSFNGVDVNCVVEVLIVVDIFYKVEFNFGVLLVKVDDFGWVCMKVVFVGVVLIDSNVGFEIFDKEQVLGISQFMEVINYCCGLEGELVCIVLSLNNVKVVCVYLVILKSLVFVCDDCKFSVLVLVELYLGCSLELSQVMVIVNLVVISVLELDKLQVIVVDQKGNLFFDQQEFFELIMVGKQFDFIWCMEGLFIQCVYNIL